LSVNHLIIIRDIPYIRFRLAGYPVTYLNPAPVPAKTVQGTGIQISDSGQIVPLISGSGRILKIAILCVHS